MCLLVFNGRQINLYPRQLFGLDMFNIFSRFLGQIEGDRAWQGDDDHIFNAFVHCPLLLKGNEDSKVAGNHLNVLESYRFYLPRCTAKTGGTRMLLGDFTQFCWTIRGLLPSYMATICLIYPSNRTPISPKIYHEFIAMWNPPLRAKRGCVAVSILGVYIYILRYMTFWIVSVQ